MNQIVSALSGQPRFTVGFMDSQLRHFGAYSKGMLPSGDFGSGDFGAGDFGGGDF
jgi:hypothetical protein